MEIHPPEHPILSFKDFLIQIGTVTVGILIALSLESLIEWNHHRHLVLEARENIRAEIEDNRRELTGHLSASTKIRSEHQAILKWIADIQATRKSSIHSLSVTYNLADMNNTSWTTAQAIGALSFMNYAEVKRGAAVYQLQDEFLRLQSRSEDAAISAMTLFTVNSGDPGKVPTSDLQDERSRIANSLTALAAEEQIGKQLEKRYEAWLKAK